jgi:hypothetical protein
MRVGKGNYRKHEGEGTIGMKGERGLVTATSEKEGPGAL